jgi:hypothetical protein
MILENNLEKGGFFVPLRQISEKNVNGRKNWWDEYVAVRGVFEECHQAQSHG